MTSSDSAATDQRAPAEAAEAAEAGAETGQPPLAPHTSCLASPARVCDHLLGGKDNYAVDRALVDDLLKIQPRLSGAAQENRAFVREAVRTLAGRGIRQFVDIGCGLPTADNLHQMAARQAPDARVVYVDHDPMVLAHARALLTDDAGASVVRADLRRPATLIDLVAATGTIDWNRPTAVVLAAILHHLTDVDDPRSVVGRLREALSPGSALVISHVTDDVESDATTAAADLYTKRSITPLVPRGRSAVLGFFEELDMLGPGLVHAAQWQPSQRAQAPESSLMYVGVGMHA
jgi:SAM-dependent methyltransferase